MIRLFSKLRGLTTAASLVMPLFFSPLFAAAQQQPANQPQPPSSGTGGFRVGGANVVLPSPDKDLVEVGPDYRVVFDVMVPDTNRLVAAFVSPDDLQVVHGKSQANLARYAVVEVLRQAEFADLSEDDFKTVVKQVAQQIGSSLASSTNSEGEEFNRKLKALNPNAADIAIDKPVSLGVLFEKTDAFGYGMILPVTSKGQTIRMVGGIAVVRVAKRLLFAYDFAVFKDEDSATAIRRNTEAWADSILLVNKEF